MATPPVIAFDLDGTLVDTSRDLVRSLNAILLGENMLPVTGEGIKSLIGSGAKVMIEAAFAAEGRALTPEKLSLLLRDYMQIYEAHVADESRPYPGCEAMLDRFAAAGWRLAVCTNKYEAPARKLLTILGLAGRFAAITGQDTFAFRKPDPRHLTETIRLAGGTPADAIMVGDSATDVDTALAANIPIVAVSWGYSPIPVAGLGATAVIESFDQLEAAVATIRQSRGSNPL